MSVIRVGATKKFADNWENIFGGTKKSKASAAKAPAKATKKSAKKQSTDKHAGKPAAAKKGRKKTR